MKVTSPDGWIFGYGSLMWAPNFEYAERHVARVHGWHRDFRLLSHFGWGTKDKPGLVATLHPGGSCRGYLFKIPAAAWPTVQAYLKDREQAYRHITVTARHAGGAQSALTFAFDPTHPRSVAKLAATEAAEYLAQGIGKSGASIEYAANILRIHRESNWPADRYLREICRLSYQLAK